MKVVTPSAENYPSVEKISESYGALKEGVSELAHQVRDEAGTTASRMSVTAMDFLKTKLADFRSEFSNDFAKVKSYVQDEPAKGLAIAFAAGALASILLRRS